MLFCSSFLSLYLPLSLLLGLPDCWWEVTLFSLLNFPTSRRFLTDSHTCVPLFLLTSLLGLCAGGARTQHWAVRNHRVHCVTWTHDSLLPHCPLLLSPCCPPFPQFQPHFFSSLSPEATARGMDASLRLTRSKQFNDNHVLNFFMVFF